MRKPQRQNLNNSINSSNTLTKVKQPINEQLAENFQRNFLNEKQIDLIWYLFRETGNSNEGKISKTQFKKVFSNQIFSKEDEQFEQLLDPIFDRFKIESQGNDEKVELQDLVISFCILARMSNDDKLKLIFRIMDVDDDGCLSIDEILTMIYKIERNFCRENTLIQIQSQSLLYELASKKAIMKYQSTIQNMNKNKKIEDNDQQENHRLITFQEFLQNLNEKPLLKNKFLPPNFPMYQVLSHFQREVDLAISEQSLDDFLKFRQEMHRDIRNNYQGNYQKLFLQEQKNIIKLPFKVETIVYQRELIGDEEHFKKTIVNSKFDNKQEYKPVTKQTKNAQDYKNSKSVLQDKDKIDNLKDQTSLLQKHERNLKQMRDFANDPKFKGTSFLQRNIVQTKKHIN